MRRRALVTGASSGIGAATAILLAEQGYDVWATYAHDADGAKATAEAGHSAGAEVHVSHLDQRSPDSITALVGEITDRWGSLDVLVNNGGTCPYRSYDQIEIEEWDDVLETNARGVFLLSRAVLPLLRASDAADTCIVNLASLAGQIGGLTTGIHYAASKAAVLAITRSFARLLAADGIRVNAVSPGPVESAITDKLAAEARRGLIGAIALRRFGTAAEAAWIVAALASPHASFVTGATYDVNGGARID